MTRRLVVIVALLCSVAGSVSADVAFPARLDVIEEQPGVYGITFTLPIVEGRKLRAEPLMPPTCTEIGERVEGASAGGFTATWSASCDPASLAGEAILVQGLLGGQTDLAFTLTTLDGRSYSRILRPSRPGFLVPEPPDARVLVVEAVVSGMRRTIRHLALWLFIFVAALTGGRTRPIVVSTGVFALGHFAAQWLGGLGWFEVSPQMRDLLVWSTLAVPAVSFAGGGDGWKGWLRPLWPIAFLIGLLYGGAEPEALAPEGLSNTEQFVALIVFSVGVWAAMLLMVAAARELRVVFELLFDGRWLQRFTVLSGYLIGVLAVAHLVTQAVGVWVSAPAGLAPSLELFLLAAVLGPTLVFAARDDVLTRIGITILAALGMVLGFSLLDSAVLSLPVLASLFVLGVALALNRPLPSHWALLVAAIAVPTHLWSTALTLVENVSRSTAIIGGVVATAATIFWISTVVARQIPAGGLRLPIRISGGAVAVAAVGWRLAEYRSWFERDVATEAALGLLRVPLAALALVVLGVILRPRQRWDDGRSGIDKKPTVRHWVALGAAFFLVPYGTIAVNNPFFSASAPRGEGARLIMSRVLSDTYHAFNIEDEDELYDALDQSVTGDLVGDIYLDNRRRLTAGVREGTEITVRDVGVIEIGDPHEGTMDDQGFSYDVVWSVVARVQHLQHVHHRKNTYGGVLTLLPMDDRWMLSGVELLSEDRVVVPWDPDRMNSEFGIRNSEFHRTRTHLTTADNADERRLSGPPNQQR